MKRYIVYFEVFGHKLKYTTYADNEEQARQKIKDKIIFHKVVKAPPDEYTVFEKLFEELFK